MSPNRPSVPRPIGVRQGRKGGNQQPNHASGSALHVMHAVHASGTEPRPPTQTRPCSSISRCSPQRQYGLRLVQLQFESVPAIAKRPASNPESLHHNWLHHLLLLSSWQSTSWQAQQPFGAAASNQQPNHAGGSALRPIGVRQGRKGGNQQPIHASGSALHVMHAVHASGTEQQAAGALDVAKPPFGAAADRRASRP